MSTSETKQDVTPEKAPGRQHVSERARLLHDGAWRAMNTLSSGYTWEMAIPAAIERAKDMLAAAESAASEGE